ncbi:unnamed protein product [Rotaria socialis]
MLRSDNIEVRSQLSATQRRMLQEKQQVMDYLRQIENDLIEKEQIKQRESILRKDYDKLQLIHKQDRQDIEKLNLQINQDKQKLDQLEQERLQLFKTIQNIDDNKGNLETELDSYKSATKRLYTYFKIPFDSIHSIDQLIPMLEDRYRTEQVSQARIHDIQLVKSATNTNHEHETEEIRQLREDLLSVNIQLKQLNDANQAWQQYQENQIILLRDRLNLTNIDNLSFDDIVQQIENRFNILNNELVELQDVKKTTEIQAVSAQYIKDHLYQSKDTQTEDAQEYKPMQKDESAEILIQKLTINSKQYEEELRELRENLATLTTQAAQLDEANQAWQQYHRTQLDNFRNKLQPSLPIEIELSLDDIAQYIANYLDQMRDERENLREQLQTSEKLINDHRSQSTDNILTTQENFASTINELNQKLLLIKQQNDQLETEKFILNQQILNQESTISKHETKPSSSDSTLSAVTRHTDTTPIHEPQIHSVMPIQSASPLTMAHDQELAQLRETVTILTDQCAQLDEANRAWQQYHQTQVQDFQSKLKDYLPLDQNTSLDSYAEQIIQLMLKTKEDFNATNEALREEIANVRLESGTNLETIKESYVNAINELNQELLAIKNQYEALDSEKQRLVDELGTRTVGLNPDQCKQNIERISSNLRQHSFDEALIHSRDATRTEDGEAEKLRETVALLTTQCAQLDEANRAWQQYHQTQLDTFKTTLQEHLPLNDTFTLDQAAQQILNQIISERQDFNQQYQALEKQNEDLRSESGTNLETIKESYVNAIEELNKELNSMKEQFELISAEKQFLTDELAKSPMGFNGGKSKESIDFTPVNAVAEISLQTTAPVLEQDNEELLQLRENFAILTSQYAQLSEANRAWQEFHQSQVNDFRTRIQDCIQIDDDLSFDAIAQKLVNEITAEREYSNERYQASEKEYNELQSESVQSRQELLFLKEQFEQVLRDKQSLMSQIENQSIVNNQERDTQAIELVNRKLLEQQSEISQLQQNLDSVTAQLDETNHSRQQSEQTQLYLLKSILPHSTKISLDELTQEIISYVNHLTTEMESLKEKAVLSDEESQHDVNQLAQELNALQNHCTQLDIANRTWQLFYDNQIDLLKEKFNIYINIDNNQSFDQIIQLIAMQFEQQKQFNENIQLGINQDNFDLLKQQLIKSQEKEQSLSQQIYTLEEECQNLEEQLKESQYSIDSLKTNLQLVSNENEQLKQQYDDLQQKSSLLTNVNQLTDFERQSSHDISKQMIQKEVRHTPIQEVQIHRVTPVRSAHTPNIEEEIRQLRADLSASSAHCLQLEEANRAWQQFHQSQLEIFRNKLQTSITLDDNFTLEQVAQQILIHFEQLEKSKENVYASDSSSVIDSLQKQLTQYQFNESMLSQNLEQLNKKLLDVSRECDEFRENNAELILSKQQLQERLQQIDEIQLSNDNSEKLFQLQQQHDALSLENQQLQSKLIDMEKCLSPSPVHATIQRIDSPRENVAIHNVNREHEQEIYQLRADLATASARCLELEEVNLAWQNYQHDQIESLRKKLQEQIPSLNEIDNASIEYLSQQIIHHLDHLYAERDNVIRDNDLLKDELRILKQQLERPRSTEPTQRIFHKRSPHKHISEPQIHSVTSSTSASPLIHEHEHEQELLQYRESVALLTTQCAQLDEANRAWQQYHQTQLDTFKNTLQEHLPMNDIFTLDQAAQQILNQIINERQDFNQQYQALEKQNEDLRSESGTNLETIKESYVNAIEELNKELNSMKEQYEQANKIESSDLLQKSFQEISLQSSAQLDHQDSEEIRQLRENLVLLTSQLDETNRAAQQYQQTQLNILRNQFQHCLSIDFDNSFDVIAQQIADHVTREREDFNEKYQTLEKQNEDLRSELTNNMESIRESYVNTVNELNQELLIMKKQCEECDTQNQLLTDELEKRPLPSNQESVEPNIEKVSLNVLKQPFEEVPIHMRGVNGTEDEELGQLRETVALLTAQCSQLDEANRAWQQYLQTQAQDFRSKLQDYLPVNENISLDYAAEQIIEQISKERQAFNEKYETLEKAMENLQLESGTNLETIKESYVNTIDELSQELAVIKSRCEQLDADKQRLSDELERRTVEFDRDRSRQNIERVSSNLLQQSFEEVPIHRSGATRTEDAELGELRETVALLTAQCTQLDEANRAWQQYHETQLDTFKNTLQEHLPMNDIFTLDQAAQQILNQIISERQDFNQQYQALEKQNEDLRSESGTNWETIKESYVNAIEDLNQELVIMKSQCEQLDVDKQRLSDELERRTTEFDRDHSRQNIERVSSNLLQQSFEEVPIHRSGPSHAEMVECGQLRETVALLTAQCSQLDEANRASQQYHQTQVLDFLSKLQEFLSVDENTSLDAAVEQIVEQISKERSDFHERFERLEKESERLQTESKANADAMQNTYQTIINGINEELVAIKKQCEEWKIEKQYLTDELEKRSVPLHQEHVERNIEKVSSNLLKQSFAEVPIHTSSMNVEGDISECQQLRETVASLTAQCAQLDEANQAWQMYHHTQLQEFRNKLQDYLSVDDNVSFDIVAQQIIDRISSEREDCNNKYQALVNKFDSLRSDMTVPAVQQSEMNTVNGFNEELSVIKEVDQKLYAEKQPLMDQIESFSTHTEPKQDIEQVSLNILKEPREQVSIHTSSVDAREDIEELQKRIAHLTSECAQLDEANRTWQRYEQTQLDNFRNRLQDYISIDEHISFDDVIHKIIEKIVQDRETLKAKCADFDRSNDYLQSESTLKMQLTEQPSTDYVDELNQELAMLRNQNEELHRINKHLVFDKENLSNQLNDRSIVLGHHTVSDLNQIPEENTDELKENSEGQSSSAPIDAEEMEKIRADLTSITDQFNQLIQTNRSELDSFRDILQNWISLPENSTLDDIAQQLKDQFEQRQQNVPHTTENQTQTIELTEKIHMAIETTPVIYENHQTQIDLVDTNDEETQTESFQQLWPILKDDNLYNHDEDDNNLLDYIDEISSLSPTDLTDRLNKECQQILIKKNLSLSSYDNLQLNHHALMTIYLLYKQHLTDDAKQLYNETLIRALRLEYELINNEKHDYMEKYNEVEEKYLNELNLNEKKMHQLQNKYEELLEHNELERLDSKKILNDLAEKYEFNLFNLHQENENLKYNLSNMSQSREKSLGNDHNQLQSQYQQLRQDYDELISENELLKDYNSQMYQRKLQRNADDQDSDEMVSLHDIDIQCNLSDERQAPNHDESSWSNNWTDEKIQQEKLVPEQKSTEDDEINRLKSIISDIQFENENLKELNAELYQIKLQYTNTDSIANESIIKSQDIDIQCLLQPITIDSFVQTEHENEPNQLISSVTEDNDWNDQLPIIEIPLGEPNVSSVTVEHKMPETVDNEAQTDEQTQDKLSQINNKLKRALQTIKDRIHQIVIEQPELFSNTNDDTLERLDHLRIIIRNQAMQINDLQNSYEQAQDEINQMQSSLEVCQDRIDNEHITKTEELASSPPSVNDRSQSAIEDSEKQIHQLQQKLSQNDDEKLLLRERLNEVELELRKVLDDHTSTRARYEEQLQSLITERDAIVEQQVLQSNENQHQIQKLEYELAQVKQSVDSAHAATTSNEDVKSLQEIIQEQSDEMKDLSEKYFTLVSQLEVQDEILKQKHQTEEQLKICENQIQHLINEHAALSEELQNKTSTSVSNIDNESQTDEQQQQDKLVQLNHKLKRALQTFKDKIHRLVTERPELFTDVGEETTERFDHLITTVEHQATHIDLLQSENEQSQEQLRNQIQELQSSLDACRYQLENERPVQSQQLVCATPPSDEISQTNIENYEMQIRQLQQKLSQHDDEKSLLRERLNEVELELRKVLDDHASTTAMYDEQLRSLITERDALVEQHALQSADKQENSPELTESFIGQHDANEENQSLKEIIRQQAEQHRELDEKLIALTSSQLESQAEFDKQKKEIEEQMNNYKNQIENLSLERTNLLEDIQKNTASPVQPFENEKQNNDQQYEKLLKVNNKLKRVLQTFKDRIHRIATERSDLFTNVGEETSERLDHLIGIVENQAVQIETLQTERFELQREINELKNSFDVYRQEIDNDYRMKLSEFTVSSTNAIQNIESEPIEQKGQVSNENQWNDWSVDAPIITDDEKKFRDVDIQCELLADNDPSTINKPTDHYESTVSNRLLSLPKNEISLWSETATNDWEEQSSPIKFPSEESRLVEHMISSSSTDQNLLEILKTKLNEIITEYPELFPNINRDTFDALDQLNAIIRNYQNQIKELQSSFDAYRYRVENEQTIRANELASSDVLASTSGLTTPDEYQKEIDQLKEQIDQNNLIYQREIQSLIEERDQAREQIQIKDKNSYKSSHSTESQASLNIDCSLAESRLSDCQSQIDVLLRERISLMEQIKQLAHQSNKQHSEIKTANDNESSTQPEQRISRRVFEQEILAWSKESEQLKQFVKQIQVENKKLKDIILKFESIIQDYMHENELLKQENQHLSFLSYSSKQITGSNENSTSSDMDICYLTLKWLTYEVAQRTSNNNEQSSLIIDDNESYLKQRLYDSERQVKSIRIQNQKLKKQLETYTIQFKHIQHEMSIKIQELSTLKIEIERLRTSETQYRLEVDRLKTDVHCNQVKFQQIERELTDAKLERTNNNNDSTNNLRELLELKERELHALKEKLDYTIQAHQLELQESIKANQFSLDNVQRFEQLDQRHQEKRKELEIRLGKICKSIKPLIDNQHLFKENSIIDFNELQDLITDTEAEQRVTTSLGPIRDCLGLLESQMKELQHNLIENHARRSQRWKYKLGFECLSCESRWEVTHDVRDLQEACQDPTMFLESSRVEPMRGCSCPLIVDFIETDVRLCIDDILDEVIIRTIVT